MSRRAWGAVVVAVSLIVAVVVPVALGLGRPRAGVAVRAPIPTPPQVGECLHAPVLVGGSALTLVGISIGTAPVGPCKTGDAGSASVSIPGPTTPENYGEILSVIADVLFSSAASSDPQATPEPGWCRESVEAYLEWTAKPWTPVLTDSTWVVGPTDEQYRTGQRWIACAVLSGDRGYFGSVRESRSGPAADVYGRCGNRPAPVVRVWCSQPHNVEVFAFGVVDDGTQDSCTRLITERTGMTDPTADGMLQVRIVATNSSADDPWTSSDGRIQSVTCGIRVAGDGLLIASLVGRGDGPLPWA